MTVLRLEEGQDVQKTKGTTRLYADATCQKQAEVHSKFPFEISLKYAWRVARNQLTT
jgi:hypothetical protein